jgi:hypothetical protein
MHIRRYSSRRSDASCSRQSDRLSARYFGNSSNIFGASAWLWEESILLHEPSRFGYIVVGRSLLAIPQDYRSICEIDFIVISWLICRGCWGSGHSSAMRCQDQHVSDGDRPSVFAFCYMWFLMETSELARSMPDCRLSFESLGSPNLSEYLLFHHHHLIILIRIWWDVL